jgi:hypothetical protein
VTDSPQLPPDVPSRDDPAAPIEDEPVTTGTLFIVLVFLMAMAGLWALMYLRLLDR